jgi:hypothetical protein
MYILMYTVLTYPEDRIPGRSAPPWDRCEDEEDSQSVEISHLSLRK